MVTVIIPTCNRPHFLREALESVRQQTALDRIGEVIVSENGGCHESKAVCEQFPDLPICYLFQEPPVPGLMHLKAIWPTVKAPFVAFLHDDDWWAPEHLERALQVLDADPQCAAVFSNHYVTEGPEHPAQVAYRWARQVWIASGCDFSRPVLKLEDESVVLAGLWGAAFHYSTVVARTKAVWASYCQLADAGNEYDNDRTFPIFLAAHGTIAYLTHPDVFVRLHLGQYNKRFCESYEMRFIQTTRWMLKRWPDKVAAAAKRFNTLASSLDRVHLDSLTRLVAEARKNLLVAECGLRIPISSEQAEPSPRDLRWFLRLICPPAVFALRRRLRGRFSAGKGQGA